jgi:hypothetical protein
MANVDGNWDTVVKTPLGDQQATLTVQSAGDTFTGQFVGAMGTAEVTNGTVEGDTIRWSMKVTVPMPLELDGEATANGDTLTGNVKAGAFGSFPLTGTRA